MLSTSSVAPPRTLDALRAEIRVFCKVVAERNDTADALNESRAKFLASGVASVEEAFALQVRVVALQQLDAMLARRQAELEQQAIALFMLKIPA